MNDWKLICALADVPVLAMLLHSLLPLGLASLVAEATSLAHSLPLCEPARADDSRHAGRGGGDSTGVDSLLGGDDSEVGESLAEEVSRSVDSLNRTLAFYGFTFRAFHDLNFAHLRASILNV